MDLLAIVFNKSGILLISDIRPFHWVACVSGDHSLTKSPVKTSSSGHRLLPPMGELYQWSLVARGQNERQQNLENKSCIPLCNLRWHLETWEPACFKMVIPSVSFWNQKRPCGVKGPPGDQAPLSLSSESGPRKTEVHLEEDRGPCRGGWLVVSRGQVNTMTS